MIRLTIPEPAPSWNQIYKSPHWRVRQQLAERWHSLVVLEARRQQLPKGETGPFTIRTLVNYPDSRIHDPDNICDKLLIDGLVKAGVLLGDDDRYITLVTRGITRDRSRPRETVVTLEGAA